MLIKKILIIVCLALLSGIIVFSIHFARTGYLSASEKIDGNMLLIEGWLTTNAIKAACAEYKIGNYDYIITTGIESDFDCGIVERYGYLIFYPKNKVALPTEPKSHLIEVRASGQYDEPNASSFNLFINDSLITNFRAPSVEKKYQAPWIGSLSDIDSITIELTGNNTGDYGDGILYVKEIIIDEKIKIPTLKYSEYDIGKLDNKDRIINNFTSYATKAKAEIGRLEIDTNSVIAISASKTHINRTLASALAVRDWLKTTDKKITGINIVSFDMHSRRTFMVYSKVLGKSYKVGIVSISAKTNLSHKKRIFKAIRETAGIVYYSFVLLFY